MSSAKTHSSENSLLEEFSPVSYDEWRKLVEVELKGVPFDKRMFTETYEGITLRPIYRHEDVAGLPHVNSFPGFAPFARGVSASGYLKRPWAISQEIACSSPAEFNQAARNSLSRGLNALNVVLDKATRDAHDPDWAQPEEVGFGGLSIATLGDLDRALEGIDLKTTSLFVRSGASAMPFAALLVALALKRGKPPASLHGCIEMDPLGVLSHEGRLPQSLAGAYEEMVALTHWASDDAPSLQTICVHSRAWHEAGGNAVQELAFTLATGIEYLREMNRRGLGPDIVAPRIRFAVTVGTDFFMEIAKLRALRMLWSRAVAALGGSEESQRISLHVRTSLWNKSRIDIHNNLLRATVEAFAGVLGGCDSMQVGAFDEVNGPTDDFSQRLARNTQFILQKECSLEHVIDPAGGSWFVETITADLAARAWGMFQEVEKLGGMAAALQAGFPQKAVAATALEKNKAINRRRGSIIGVNQYANTKEPAHEVATVDCKTFHRQRVRYITSHRTFLGDEENSSVLEKLSAVCELKGAELFGACVEAFGYGATLGEISRSMRAGDTECTTITPVCLARAAAPFEQLRAAADRYTVQHQSRPAVFLCNMGSLRDYKARADFSCGFFACGGYDVISPAGFQTPKDAAKAFADSKSRIAIICSSDTNYPAVVPPLAAAIRARTPEAIIVLAGFPQDQIESFKQAGVDEFVHIRANAIELLTWFHKQLGLE